MAIHIKRIYEPFAESDGYRVLVDRLWPRGVSKEDAHLDAWLKEVAPSAALRKWFNHEPDKWKEFTTRYRNELNGSDGLKELIALKKKYRSITLLYGAKDEMHNQAVVLLEILK